MTLTVGDEDRLFACAMKIERSAAKRLGQTILVGVSCKLLMPPRPVISFGVAGALSDDLPVGQVVDINKVVDENGTVLWEGRPLGIRGAYVGAIVTTDHIVNNSQERLELCKRSGAKVVDMETGIYAREGKLVGGARVISDSPRYPLTSMRGICVAPVALWVMHTFKL